MKKIYLFVFIAFISIIKAQVPTCSLNPTFIASNKNGIFPDSATNFVSGMVGIPYQQNITVKIPKDTISGSIKFCFNRFVLSNPSTATNYKLPNGLNFGVNLAALQNGTINAAPSFKFPGNANNCAMIYGTPTTAGVYTLSLKVDAYATPTIGSCSPNPNVSGGSNVSTQTLNYYIITILPNTVGMKEVGKNSFNLSNVPNPFSNKTTIKYFVSEAAPVKITVYNTLGDAVYSATMNAEPGDNEHLLHADNWNNGMYFYTIKYKNYSETKRMILFNN